MYCNINTQAITDSLPRTIQLPGVTITGPSFDQLAAEGWRILSTIRDTVGATIAYTQAAQAALTSPQLPQGQSQPDVVLTWSVQDLDGRNAVLVPATTQTAADWYAAIDAAVAQQVTDEKAYASALAETGTVPIERALRAFAALALQEINALRTKAGLSTYTAQQFLTAWRAKL